MCPHGRRARIKPKQVPRIGNGESACNLSSVHGMLPQSTKTEATLFKSFDQWFQHGRSPRVFARPDTKVGEQDVPAAHIAQRITQQRAVAHALAGELITQKACRCPAHMRISTGTRTRQQLGRSLAPWGSKQRQRRLACDLLEPIRGFAKLLAIVGRRHHKALPFARACGWADAKRRLLSGSLVSAPIRMVPGVRSKLVALCRPLAPPRCPVVTQAAITLLCALIGGKESHAHVLPLEHVSHQRCNAHVSGVKSQVQGFFTVFFGAGA